MPETTTRPPARVIRSARLRLEREPTQSIATSAPPSRNEAPRSGLSFIAPVARRTALVASLGSTISFAPNAPAHSRCLACLATTATWPAFVSSLIARSVRMPTVPAPMMTTFALGSRFARRAVWTAQESGSSRTALRFGEPVGDGVELRAVRDEHLAPAAAGVGAVAGLQAGAHVAGGDPVAAAVEARLAVVARVEAAGEAAQDGFERDPGALREVVDVVQELADHLVAGDERERDQRREVEGGLAADRGEVRAADAGEQRADAPPARAERHDVLAVDEPHRRERAAQEPGDAAADRAGGEVARDRAEELDGLGGHLSAPPASGTEPGASPRP